MIGPFGWQGPASTLRQCYPQMTQRRGSGVTGAHRSNCILKQIHINSTTLFAVTDMFAQRFVTEHENISLQLAAPLSIRDENHLTLPLLGVFVGQTFVLGT